MTTGGARIISLSRRRSDGTNAADCITRSSEMSFEKFFAARFAAFLEENYASPAQIAAAFRVRERTAENWLNGLNAPSGAKVARAWTLHPAAARRHLAAPAAELRRAA